jgi:hypothetical protein
MNIGDVFSGVFAVPFLPQILALTTNLLLTFCIQSVVTDAKKYKYYDFITISLLTFLIGFNSYLCYLSIHTRKERAHLAIEQAHQPAAVAVQVAATATKAPTTKEERKAVEASAKLANIQLQSAKLAQEQRAEQKKEIETKKQTESEKTDRNAYLIVLFDLLAVVFKFAASYIWASRGEDEKSSTTAPAPNSPAPPAPNPPAPPAPKIPTNPNTPHPAPQPEPPAPKPAGKITPLFLAPAAQTESETSEDLANVSDEDIKKRFTSNRARMLRNEAGSEEKYNLYLSELEARNLEIPQQRPRKTG